MYYLGYPLGRFAGLKHRQLARQVGVIITTGRIRRAIIYKINILYCKQIAKSQIEASRRLWQNGIDLCILSARLQKSLYPSGSPKMKRNQC
jgi:hypothetical protein